MFKLRDYQTRACELVWEAWKSDMRRAAVVIPTGGGKTVTFVELIRQWIAVNPGKRAVVLVHREELAQQAVDKVKAMMPTVSVGVVKADRDETSATVVVCSTQTLVVAGRSERLTDVGLVVVDECHHYAADTWKAVLTRLGCFSPDGPVTVGWTATLSRGDGVGLGSVWEDVVYQRGIMRMIMDGHLCDVKALAVEVDGLDLGKVSKKVGGDFADGSLSDALEASGAHIVIAKAYKQHARREDGTYRPGVVFAPTVKFAGLISGAMVDEGITSDVVSGKTPMEDRNLIYKRYRERDTDVINNCMVLTEGWDAPWAEVAVIARPTRSNGLYIQMVGRVLRTHPGKTGALVLDICGSAKDNSLCGIVDLSDDMPAIEGDESVREAVERIAKETPEGAGSIPVERVEARDVEMFRQARGNWLQTRKGTWFNQTRYRTYFIWPARDGSGYMLGRYDNRGSLKSTGVWMKDGRWTRTPATDATRYDMSFALSLGDGEAMDDDPSIGGKDAPWRKGKRDATPEQINFARRLGIDLTDRPTKNELSQRISIRVVSDALHGRA